jgi:O-antigen ligase
MAGFSIARLFERTQLARLADGLAVAVAVSLPWSTSATGILVVLWLLAFIPTLTWPDIRSELATPAGGLPVLLVLLGVIGMAWADVSWHARWGGLDGFAKLLVIPLLMAQFRRSENGHNVFIGFLIACLALLIASWIVTVWPDISRGAHGRGVAVKSYIVQSAEFAMCAMVLVHFAVERARQRRWVISIALAVMVLAFLFDIFFISTSRTTLVILPALVLLYGLWRFGWKGFFGAAAVGLILAAALWTASPYLRATLASVSKQTEAFEIRGEATSAGERIVFWTKSLRFIASAPLFGHGTGSITPLFQRAAAGHTGVHGEVAANPHNLTFAVGIQLGLVGIAVLWAMWIAQFMVFRGTGWVAWIGLVIVTQNVVGSLFNSFLFDFTEGWTYVVGFGVAVGMMQRQFLSPPGDAKETAMRAAWGP